jgi:hypothetical protein
LEDLAGVPAKAAILKALYLLERAKATEATELVVLIVELSANLIVTSFQPSTAVVIQVVGWVHGVAVVVAGAVVNVPHLLYGAVLLVRASPAP